MSKDVQRYHEAERRLWEHVGVVPSERWVTLASGGQVRVQEVGEGTPFVLLHGAAIADELGATLAAALEGVRCILVDRPGCGLSAPIIGGPLRDLGSVQRYADHLLTDELLSKLTMRVLFLWGEHDPNGGAAVARTFAARLPNAKLVIVPAAEHAPWLDDVEPASRTAARSSSAEQVAAVHHLPRTRH